MISSFLNSLARRSLRVQTLFKSLTSLLQRQIEPGSPRDPSFFLSKTKTNYQESYVALFLNLLLLFVCLYVCLRQGFFVVLWPVLGLALIDQFVTDAQP